MNIKEMPKRAAIQQKLHKNPNRPLSTLEFAPPAQNMGVLYFYGLEPTNDIDYGWVDSKKEVVIMDPSQTLLTAVWAAENECDYLKKLSYVEKLGYVRWLRKQHFAAQNNLSDLEKLPSVDPALWRWKIERWCPPMIIADIQPNILDDVIMMTLPGPFDDILKYKYQPDNGYFTPDKISQPVRDFFGEIDLDPASNSLANDGDAYNMGIRAKKFYSEVENGLEQEWFGKVYLSPNFGEWDSWMPKLVREWKSGRVSEMIVNCSGDSAMNKNFIPIRKLASAVFFSEGRFNFWGPQATDNTHGTILWYSGPRPLEFQAAFAKVGDVFVK